MNENLILEVQTRYILHWNYRGYQELPQELLHYGGHIEEIYFKENDLTDIPDDLSKHLKHIRQLYFYGNKISSLPSSIGSLQTLTLLDLSRNRLRCLPDEIGDLTNLVTLDLSHNYISQLPDSIGNLTNLEYLVIIKNGLESLPKSIGKLKLLESLHVSGNKLKVIPPEIAKCSSLADLYIDGNQLRFLPYTITQLPNLMHVNASRNQLISLPTLPFLTCPRVIFDNNPEIHHIPFLLGCQQNNLGPSSTPFLRDQLSNNHENKWYFPVRGCFSTTNKNGSNTIFNCFVDQKKLIRAPPSLTELAFRASYKILFEKQVDCDHGNVRRRPRRMTLKGKEILNASEILLPKTLKILLLKGPTAICCNLKCLGPIFDEANVCFSETNFAQFDLENGDRHWPLTSRYFCGEWCMSQSI